MDKFILRLDILMVKVIYQHKCWTIVRLWVSSYHGNH